MEEIECGIRRVVEDHHIISSSIRSEEAKIDGLNKEIKLLLLEAEDGVCSPPPLGSELQRRRVENLLRYQTTLISRATSRTQLVRALHDDLLNLFIRRKQLRQSQSQSGVDVVPNVSVTSGLSSGNDENQAFANDTSIPASMDIIRASEDHEIVEKITTAEQDQVPLGLKMLQINMNEDACLNPEDGTGYGDIQYKNNVLDNIAMSILEPNPNVDNIFNQVTQNSDCPCADSHGSKKVAKKMSCVTRLNFARRLTVDFDDGGNPTGANASSFKRSINSYVCHMLPVKFKQIGDVPVEDYKSVLHVLTERYNFDTERNYTRKKISSCYRQHKYKLLVQVKKEFDRGIEPQKPSYVKKEDWDAFLAKTKDEEFDKISKKNKASRSQQIPVSRKDTSHASDHKRKLKGSEQELVEDATWSKAHDLKRGRPGNLSTVVEDNNVTDTMGLPVDQEGFELEQRLKDYSNLEAPSQYQYWNSA